MIPVFVVLVSYFTLEIVPLCVSSSLSVIFLPFSVFPFLTSPVLFPPHSTCSSSPHKCVCVCVCVCVFIVFVLPHVVGSFLRLLSFSVINGCYSVSVCGPLCRCPVFLNHVSSCLALVCFWFLFLLFLIDLIDLPLLHFV